MASILRKPIRLFSNIGSRWQFNADWSSVSERNQVIQMHCANQRNCLPLETRCTTLVWKIYWRIVCCAWNGNPLRPIESCALWRASRIRTVRTSFVCFRASTTTRSWCAVRIHTSHYADTIRMARPIRWYLAKRTPPNWIRCRQPVRMFRLHQLRSRCRKTRPAKRLKWSKNSMDREDAHTTPLTTALIFLLVSWLQEMLNSIKSNQHFSADGQLYSATAADFSGGDPLIYRETQRTEQFNAKQLNQPSFVSTLERNGYVFFFFRELALENCGKTIYSRVARVCKNDRGGPSPFRERWTSYLKTRLNCSTPGDFPFYFDELRKFKQIFIANGTRNLSIL